MRSAFKANGTPCPDFRLVTSEEELIAAMPVIGFPSVIKPAWGSDSEFVIKVTSEEEAKQVFSYVKKNATPKFNPIFRYNDSQFVFEQFMERGDSAPTRYPGDMKRRIDEAVKLAHAAVGVKSAVTHTEVKITPNGPMVVEIASRMGGDYIWDWVKTIWGVDLVEESFRIALGILVRAEKRRDPAC